MINTKELLIDNGFMLAGTWSLKNNSIIVSLTQHEYEKNILYSFVCDGIIKYIGKTTKTLHQRMYQYQNPGESQKTNHRVNALLLDSLKKGTKIEIFVLQDTQHFKHGIFDVNLAAGLEDNFIHVINPEWNKSGKKNDNKKETVENNLRVFRDTNENSFKKTKQKRYAPLYEYLVKQSETKITLSFQDLESIINHTLPPSAYSYDEWWSNGVRSHNHAFSWLDAGWKVSKYELGVYVVFEKE